MLLSAVSEVTQSQAWHDTPAHSGTPAKRDRASWHRLSTASFAAFYKSFAQCATTRPKHFLKI